MAVFVWCIDEAVEGAGRSAADAEAVGLAHLSERGEYMKKLLPIPDTFLEEAKARSQTFEFRCKNAIGERVLLAALGVDVATQAQPAASPKQPQANGVANGASNG